VTDVFSTSPGNSPLLISVPHDGRAIPDAIAGRMTAAGRDIADTDWHVARLYEFAGDLDASMLVANYSRYVVDLNRPANDAALYAGQVATGICPDKSFAGEPLYTAEGVDAAEQAERVRTYWQPYHDAVAGALQNIRERHGYALLWDAHSIPGRVPRLFDGDLPVLNLGSNDEDSCDTRLTDAVFRVAAASPYTAVRNGRFKGGHITRHYGCPDRGIHALQLEIAQHAYMDEKSRKFDEAGAKKLRQCLREMLQAFMSYSASEE